MGQVLYLASTVVAAVAIIAVFAFLRRVMRQPNAPRWINNDGMAYTLSMLLTILFSMSLVTMAIALQPYLANGFALFAAALLIHILIWSVLRVVIPVQARPKTKSTPDVPGDAVAP